MCSTDITHQDMFDLAERRCACLLQSVDASTLTDCSDVLLEIQHDEKPALCPHGTLSARKKESRTDLEALVVEVNRGGTRLDSDVLYL